MWRSLGQFILKYRFVLLTLLVASTAFMAYWASKMQISYDFSRAIPTDNPKYRAYQDFRKKFGEDGNLLVIGLQSNKVFTQDFFNKYARLQRDLKSVNGVEDVLSMPSAVNLVKDSMTEKLQATAILDPKNCSRRRSIAVRRSFSTFHFTSTCCIILKPVRG